MISRAYSPNRWLLAWLPAALFGIVFTPSAQAQEPESWDAIYLGGSKIGFVHTYVEKVAEKGKEYLRVRVDIRQDIKRGNDISTTKLQYGTIETPDGQVLRLHTRTQAGDDRPIEAHGDVIKGKMKFILEGTGERQEQTIAWAPDVRGPYAAEQSMARKPMKEHEERTLKMFVPVLNKICKIVLHARTYESTVLGDSEPHSLLRVEQTTELSGKPMPEYDATMWVDKDGQVLKLEQDILSGVVMLRTTKEAALSDAGPVKFDLITGSAVKVAKPIPDPEKTRFVSYRLSLKNGDPTKIIPSDARQSIKPGDQPNSAILEVNAVGPADGEADPSQVDPEYTKPNVLVTSKDRTVVSLARQVTRGVSNPWEKAVRINHWVFQNVNNKHFELAFAAASEVARDRSGDCTEHAVLAAAMCRAVGIPARVVVGMVYADELHGFGYHMWNEVHVKGRWIAIDPTWDETLVDATHIKLVDSSLEGVAPFDMFTPLVRVMGKLSIEPIELREER